MLRNVSPSIFESDLFLRCAMRCFSVALCFAGKITANNSWKSNRRWCETMFWFTKTFNHFSRYIALAPSTLVCIRESSEKSRWNTPGWIYFFEFVIHVTFISLIGFWLIGASSELVLMWKFVQHIRMEFLNVLN